MSLLIVQKEELIKTKFGLIPNDWRIKRLQELGSSIIGLTYSPKDVVDKNEGILVLRSSNIQNGRLSFKDNVYVDMEIKDKLYVKKGDLLVCARNGSKQLIGKNAYIDKDYNYSFGAFMSVFRSDYNEYIYQLFQTDMYKKQIQANLGATINQITTKDINSFQFPFPKNIKEQQKIASILSTWDKAIELKEKLIEQKKEQKKGLMQRLLTGEVRLPGFDGEWRKVRLEEISECLDNKRRPLNSTEREGMRGNIPYYGANGIVDYVNDFIFDERLILLAEDGGHFNDFMNKPIAMRIDGKAWVNNHAHILRITGADFDFIYFSLVHKDIRKYINGTTRGKLTKSDMLSIELKLPIDIKEQMHISKLLSNVTTEIQLLDKEITELKQQKKGLMQQLLTGKVRVKV